ncbi:MAG: LysR family transcriptional regulator [Lachnospiraceae bacterium]|nr:LysR family transcriptional regulator [Lachnospiraceae bacterium]
MEITQIRYFLEVANSLHITSSAQKLHIAQPALSQAIHRLEKELGVSLIQKEGRNIVLTEYGTFLKERLEPIMEKLDEIPELLRIMSKLGNETIHLSVLAATPLVTDAVIAFKKDHPEISFQFLQYEQNELYDIEITTKMFYQNVDERRQFVCGEKIYLAVPGDSTKFMGKNSIALKDVADEEFISLLGSRQLRNICDKFCKYAGFAPNVIFESESSNTVKDMIAAGFGVGFWPEISWGEIDKSKIKLLEITDPVCYRDIVVTCKYNKADNSHVEEFFQFLKLYFEDRINR